MNDYTLIVKNQAIEDILPGMSIIKSANDDLMTVKCCYISKSDTPLDALDNATLSINNKKYEMIVSRENVDIYSIKPLTYLHTLELVEPIAKTRKHVVDSISTYHELDSKQTFLDVLNHVRNIVPVQRKDLFEKTRIFDLNTFSESDLAKTEFPETSFSANYLFDTLKSIGSIGDAFPKIESKELVFREYNKKGKEIIKNNNIIGVNSNIDSIDYASSLFAYLSNTITNNPQIYPSSATFISARTEQIVVSDNASEIVLSFPIHKLLKVELLCKQKKFSDIIQQCFNSDYVNRYGLNVMKKEKELGYSIFSGDKDDIILDITKYVVSFEEYATLNEESDYSKKTKRNCLKYNFTSKSIEGVGSTYHTRCLLFDTENSILEELLSSWGTDHNFNNEEPQLPILDAVIRKCSFRVTYIPYINPLIVVQDPFTNKNKAEMIVGQSSNISDLNKQSKYLKNLLKKLGHADKNIIRIFQQYEDCNSPLDYISNENYILTSVESIIFQNYVLEIGQYNKNFNRKSNFTGINQEVRSFDISNNEVLRKVNYQEFVILSFDENKYNDSSENSKYYDSILTSDGIALFMRTFNQKTSDSIDTAITFAIIKTFDKNNNILVEDDGIIFNTIIDTYDNNIFLHFEFPSTISAGERVTNDDTQKYNVLDPVRYVDTKAEFYYLDIELRNVKKTSPEGTYMAVENLPPLDNPFKGDYVLGTIMTVEQVANFSPSLYYTNGKYYKECLSALPKGYLQNTLNEGWSIYDDFYWKYYKTILADDSENLRDSYSEKVSDAMNYPLFKCFDANKTNVLADTNYREKINGIDINIDKRFVVDKKLGERISFTYIVSIVSDNKKIIIGNYFSKYCRLVNSDIPKLFVWLSEELYEDEEKEKAKGILSNINILFEEKGLIRNPFYNPSISIGINNNTSKIYKSWAIADRSGNLVVASNYYSYRGSLGYSFKDLYISFKTII